MALCVIEGVSEKRSAQRLLEKNLKAVLPSQGVRNIGYPGGNADHLVYAKGPGELWFAPAGPQDNRIPRFWNSFGVFRPEATAQNITVEVNIPTESNSGRVAGFFAKDTETGEVFLMHSGRVAGGRKGIGKTAFLAWSNPTLFDASTGGDQYRSAFIVSPLSAQDLAERIWLFVRRVAEFKSLAVTGALNTAEFQKTVTVYKKYSKGFSGRKRGSRQSEIDYFTFHDDVVDALAAARSKCLDDGEQIVKTNLIDLGVRVGTDLVELYEVKTSCDRQSLYAALGQVLTHSAGAPAWLKKFIVLPADGQVPTDISDAVSAQGITVQKFTMRRSGQRAIVSLSL